MNDCDWMAGGSLESCKVEYLRACCGGSADDDEEMFDGPYELDQEQMDRMKFCDEDGARRTFQEELDRLVAEGAEFPRFFASTEF